MPLTVLSQSQLRSLLLSLNRDEIIGLQRSLAEALRDYSTGSQDQGCSASYQPQRTAITRKNGCTTLFMPATTGQTIGIKMISLQDGGTAGCAAGGGHEIPPGEKTASRSRTGLRNSMSSVSSDASDQSTSSHEDNEKGSISSSSLVSGTVNQQPVTSGLSETMGAWPGAGTRDTSPQGSITLLNAESLPFGLINAHELTAFRTALVALMIFNKRKKVKTITVFGAGKQAYWHIRLALILRGSEIKKVNIMNRSFERSAELLRDIYSPSNASWRGDVKFTAVSSDFVEYNRLLHAAILKSDAIFCCTPSIEPLFPAEFLTSRDGRQKGRLVSAIGSYKPHMTELHPDILRDEVNVGAPHRHFHKHTKRSGVVVVDSLDAAFKEAGEIIQAEIKAHQAVELGELLMVREASRQATEDDGEEDKKLREWVERGNVIYKSVGLGLMDLVAGGDLVRLARERNVGTTIEDF
ncbi:Proline utilization protein [Aspergillus sclerotialis]|uniref:Proline utilization protein n=1 Tax=Aspergillus sclerotialis TaxID=2070753 RepID=A0A3A2ZA06_9EURO|nr:Proline utilization protein [Aspergillus sclerotialis]